MSVGRPKKIDKAILDADREARALKYANSILEEHKTVRQIASENGVSKSTVQKYLHTYIDSVSLRNKVNKALDSNYATKHLKGGEATKNKFANEKKNKKMDT